MYEPSKELLRVRSEHLCLPWFEVDGTFVLPARPVLRKEVYPVLPVSRDFDASDLSYVLHSASRDGDYHPAA
jgi:hypothetical protein